MIKKRNAQIERVKKFRESFTHENFLRWRTVNGKSRFELFINGKKVQQKTLKGPFNFIVPDCIADMVEGDKLKFEKHDDGTITASKM